VSGHGLARIWAFDARCAVGVQGGSCAVDAAPATYTFRAIAPPPRLATLTFQVSGERPDPDLSDNAATVGLAS
jgi:hypothetical protein